MVKNRNRSAVCAFVLWIVTGFFISFETNAEFYRYRDKDGKVHFVDDISKVPPEHRKDLKTYTERFENLSETERNTKLEDERQKAAEISEALQNIIRKRREIDSERRKRESESKTYTTSVRIKGNHVLIPVKLGYGRKEIQAMFVLDTGAEITVMHQDIADRLNIRGTKKGFVRVAGGQKVEVGVAKLNHLKVGPHEKKDLTAVIMSPESPTHYNGLLGMNFLRDLEYSIDFENRLIRWKL
jgi:hypothetical protein